MNQRDIIFEHRFWLQILGDHGRFILNELSPTEIEEIQGAKHFIDVFDKLLEISRQQLSDSEVIKLTNDAYHYAQELRTFKLNLLRQHLAEKIKIGLPPTFINHMLNELEEYLRVIEVFKERKPYCMHAVHHHLLWLIDASGHATAIINGLDDVEKRLKLKAKDFEMNFEDLYLKAIEMAGYLRTNLSKFPALSRFNVESKLQIGMFMEYLKEIEELRLSKKALGTLMPLILDHMFREECYYLIKLSMVTDLARPDCDPTKPRLEG
jgi:hypothetical protein